MRENKKAPSGLGEFFRHLCLQTRLTLWICSIVLLSVSVTAALGTNRMIRNKEEEIRDLLFNVADIVAQNPTVINDLQWTEPSAEGAIQALSQSLTQYITDVSLVVVCDMDSILLFSSKILWKSAPPWWAETRLPWWNGESGMFPPLKVLWAFLFGPLYPSAPERVYRLDMSP